MGEQRERSLEEGWLKKLRNHVCLSFPPVILKCVIIIYLKKKPSGWGWCWEVEPALGVLKTWTLSLSTVHTKPDIMKSMLSLQRWLQFQFFSLEPHSNLTGWSMKILLIWHYSFENTQLNWSYWTSHPCLCISSMFLFWITVPQHLTMFLTWSITSLFKSFLCLLVPTWPFSITSGIQINRDTKVWAAF